MSNISYSTVMSVTLSWDKAKSTNNFSKRAGELIFARVFEIEPKARSMFGFEINEDIKANPKFSVQASKMVDMIDLAVGFLGPDLDPLKDDLVDLGKRHVSYGVATEYLPVMERAVTYALEEILDDGFTREDRRAWQVIFHFMIAHMIVGMKE